MLIITHDPALTHELLPAVRAHALATDIAADGVEANRLLARHEYSVIVLDLDLPDGSALQLLDSVGADPGARPNVVIVTAADTGHVSRTDRDAIQAVILKPVDAVPLASYIRVLALGPASAESET